MLKKDRIQNDICRALAFLLILLTMIVSIPLSIRTYRDNGGPWGFGIIGLHLLLPLNAYILFAVTALFREGQYQRMMFIGAHAVSLLVGSIAFIVFPILPAWLLLVPALVAMLSIFDRKHFTVYLMVLLILAVVANLILLKWEFDFSRTIPILEIFRSAPVTENQ
jgi:hypothetical protein